MADEQPLPDPRAPVEWTAGVTFAHLARVLASRTAIALGWWLLVVTVLAHALDSTGGLCWMLWPFVVPFVCAAGYPIGFAIARGLNDRAGFSGRVILVTASLVALGVVIGGTALAGLWGPFLATSDRTLIVVLASGFAVMTTLVFTWVDG